MATKQEILQSLNQYDVETLAKLERLAETVLIPNKDQLVSADFDSMVTHAHDLADVHFPQWTDRNKSDFGEFLIELMALFSDKDFWYINAFSKEGFLTKATRYRNVVHNAISMGYKPPSLVSAIADFTMSFASGTVEVVPRGSIEFGIANVPEATFTNLEFSIPNSSQTVTAQVPMINGILKEYNGNFNGRSVLITDNNVSNGTTELYVNGDLWTEVGSFVDGTPLSKFYMAIHNELGQAEIVFAPVNYGLTPTLNDTVFVSYIVGGGTIGNILSGTLNKIIKADTNRSTITIEHSSDTIGGQNLLPLESVVQNAISWQRNLGHTVNVSSAESIAKELTTVHNAKGLIISNLIFLYIVPVGGGQPSPTLLSEVGSHLEDNVIMQFALIPSNPIEVKFQMSIDVYVLPQNSNSGTKTVVEDIIRDYTDSGRNANFGSGILRSELSNLILSQVNGVQNVDYNSLYKGDVVSPVPPADDMDVLSYEITDWSNSTINVNVIGGI